MMIKVFHVSASLQVIVTVILKLITSNYRLNYPGHFHVQDFKMELMVVFLVKIEPEISREKKNYSVLIGYVM